MSLSMWHNRYVNCQQEAFFTSQPFPTHSYRKPFLSLSYLKINGWDVSQCEHEEENQNASLNDEI